MPVTEFYVPVVLLYDRVRSFTDVDEVRKELFTYEGRSVDAISGNISREWHTKLNIARDKLWQLLLPCYLQLIGVGYMGLLVRRVNQDKQHCHKHQNIAWSF